MHRPRRERSSLASAGSPEVRVEVVDVGCRELRDREMAEVRLQVMLDQALRLAQRACRPLCRRSGKPAIEEI